MDKGPRAMFWEALKMSPVLLLGVFFGYGAYDEFANSVQQYPVPQLVGSLYAITSVGCALFFLAQVGLFSSDNQRN